MLLLDLLCTTRTGWVKRSYFKQRFLHRRESVMCTAAFWRDLDH